MAANRDYGTIKSGSAAAILAVLLLGLATRAFAQGAPQADEPRPPKAAGAPTHEADPQKDGAGHRFQAFDVRYHDPERAEQLVSLGELPPAKELLDEPIRLAKVDDGFVAPRPGLPTETVLLSDPVPEGVQFYESALKRIGEAVVKSFNRRGVIGVYVTVRILDGVAVYEVFTTRVAEVRTLAFGDRVAESDRVDFKGHSRIRDGSPVRPERGTDLLRKDALDEYVHRLNRHPGRVVDISISRRADPGEITLDYLVSEDKPWLVYGQISNTGTETTRKWRQRFGFIHNQLTGRDDILALDYVTAGFDRTHAATGSYDFPLVHDALRLKLHGAYSEFTAYDVGLARAKYEGDEWSAGADLFWNAYQRGQWFLDLFAGAKWRSIRVDDDLLGLRGDQDFFLPRVGARLERSAMRHTTFATVYAETNVAEIASTDRERLARFGRLHPDRHWYSFHWDARHSMFLDPALKRIFGAPKQTLAHELTLAFRGQHSGDRLPPHFQSVAGGMYSVRGYRESVAAGDTVFVASVEYGLHIPRLLPRREEPASIPVLNRPFRVAPQQPYGAADWNLVVRPFFDYGRTQVNKTSRAPYETNETLMGAGIGVQATFMRYLNVRCDYGISLKSAGEDSSGSHRLHFETTLSF